MMGIVLVCVGVLYVLSYVVPGSGDEPTGGFLKSYKLLSPHHDGITVNGKDRLSEKDSKHTLICAETGSGKSSNIIIPSLLQHDDASIMVLDPKGGELLKATARHFAKKGYKIKVLDYSHPEISLFFNPIQRANTDTELRQLCQNIYDCTKNQETKADKIWENGAIRIMLVLLQCIKHMPEEYHTLATLTRFVKLIDDKSPKISYIVSKYAPDESVKEEYESIKFSEPKIRMGWTATALTALSAFTLKGIQTITAKDTFHFESFRTQKTVVYLNFPVGIAESYSTLVNLFYVQFFRFLLNEPLHEKSIPCYIYLEELANSRVPQLEQYIALLRSKKVHFICVLQNLSQLTTIYGKDTADTIINNCSNLILLPGTKDSKTLNYVEALLGEREISLPFGSAKKTTSLMTKFQIRTMKHILLIPSDKPAVKLYPTPIYKNKGLMKQCSLVSNQEGVISEIPYIIQPHGIPLDVPQFSFESEDEKKRKERYQELSDLMTS